MFTFGMGLGHVYHSFMSLDIRSYQSQLFSA